MSRIIVALHVVEKKVEDKKLACVDEINQEWVTGDWTIGDDTANDLIGGMIYIHRGQKIPSHKGGVVTSFTKESETRKKFYFRALESAENVVADGPGWGNESKHVWDNSIENNSENSCDDESSYPEGKEIYRKHRNYERSKAVVLKAKNLRLASTGKLDCEVCGFDFVNIYGDLGYGYIEAHHKLPVSQVPKGHRTKVNDLALVCANCHRMLHRGKKLLTVEKLKISLAK
ncbi:HNH endonuclease [Vibrio splendidus]|uniref:HNH endonuclease n=1 Tax=Vibrio splendidus TaxID=29497 RepID=A0ABD5ACH9_VIBSP|nr:HNH endonuclease [Vibrio splendidus]MDP2490733.1 HNH endonuclease [Vibrio splendidus]